MLRDEGGMSAHRRLLAIVPGRGGRQPLCHEIRSMRGDHLAPFCGKVVLLLRPEPEPAAKARAGKSLKQVVIHPAPIGPRVPESKGQWPASLAGPRAHCLIAAAPCPAFERGRTLWFPGRWSLLQPNPGPARPHQQREVDMSLTMTREVFITCAVTGSGATQDRSERKAEEARDLARKMAIAAVFALPVFLIEMGGHLIPSLHHLIAATIGQQTSWILQFLLTTVVLASPGRAFYTKGIPALLKGAPDMNSLVAVGTGAAYLYSVVATFLPDLLPAGVRAVYFEAAAVIVVLILLGRFLEARAKGRTGAAIQKLLGLQARTARVMRDGESVEIEIDALVQGDIVIVRPGERIAVDGEVIEVEDGAFAKPKDLKGKKEADFFAEDEGKKALPAEYIAMQNKVDTPLAAAVKKTDKLAAYLKARFTLSKGDVPHKMVF